MNNYTVYMVHCYDGTYYIGVTNDLERRLNEHNEGLHPSCFTFRRRPVSLVYCADFDDVNNAIAWEKHIKRWSHIKKAALAERDEKLLSVLSRSQYRKRIDVMVRRAHHDIVVVMSP